MSEIKPVTANQMFLAKMAGMEVEVPKPVTVDQIFMQKIIDNGGASSWNDLKDKPFGEVAGGIIEFDGNMTGLDTIYASPLNNWEYDGYYCKVSDKVYAKQDLIGATVSYKNPQLITNTIYEQTLQEAPGATAIMGFNAPAKYGNRPESFGILCVYSASELNAAFGGDDFENGVYFTVFPDQNEYAQSLVFPSSVKPLDEKYLPILTSPSGKKFKLSVDDSGTISATEV